VWGEWQTTWTGYTHTEDDNGTEWKVFGGNDLKAGDKGWTSWEQWEAAGSPIDSSTGLPASS